MKKDDKIFYAKLIGIFLAGGIIFYIVRRYAKGKTTQGRSIIVGDSQTEYIAAQSQKVKMLGAVGGDDVLWKGGWFLSNLKNAVDKYPVTNDVSNVVINIGTNGGFSPTDDISGLVKSIKRAFPKANLLAVQGSWGWGGNANTKETEVKAYYKRFAEQGVKVIEPPIGAIEPHGHKPIYKVIGKNLDSAIK